MSRSPAPASESGSASTPSEGDRGPETLLFRFGGGTADGNAGMKALLGGKGANLAEMARIGLSVPPGFTLPTSVCTWLHAHGADPEGLEEAIQAGVTFVEGVMGTRFGDPTGLPLLLSVRSGARDSMPGMMDTVLNLGLNDVSVEALARASGDPVFAWDSYRRLLEMYADVVLGVERQAEAFRQGTARPTEAALRTEVARIQARVREETGAPFPQDPMDQLRGAIAAVFGSWMTDRAVVYRRRYGIPESWGTAVNVQAMVFGNLGEGSATGVAFTRNPATGENVFYGEYLLDAQGEDVVAGIRTPRPVAELARDLPRAHAELERVRGVLERHFRDVQDFEFTVQNHKVWILQTRNGKRTARAALRISMEMLAEGLIDEETALLRNPPDQLAQLLAPVFDPTAVERAILLCHGLPAGPGAASGQVVLDALQAVEAEARGESVILVREETSPDDLRGMIASRGILTARGGVSSHAALVARQLGRVCVTGADALVIDLEKRTVTVGSRVLNEGDSISVDGTTGAVMDGRLATRPSPIVDTLLGDRAHPPAAGDDPVLVEGFLRLMRWADRHARLQVRANADTPDQLRTALAFGAQGIGLCRTEHMFLGEDRIDAMREMILAQDTQGRRAALDRLLPLQRDDFREILTLLEGRPATIRLLDPPLHEFLPSDARARGRMAHRLGIAMEEVESRVRALEESNPMLGFRGCRLGIVYEEISEMQVRALLEAAADVLEAGGAVHPEIMIPLVGFEGELSLQAALVERVAARVQEERGREIPFRIGTMIEVPRATLVADEIARHATFFSFGTNDLTQMTLGMSRDDAGTFLPAYVERRILPGDPFSAVDERGVGALVEMAVAKGRAARPTLELGVCGEHGGDPPSVAFFHRVGLDYVSCSPFRVPVARLAAAHAALRSGERG